MKAKKKFNVKIKRIILTISIFLLILFFGLIVAFTVFYNKYDLNISKLTSVNNGIRVYSSSGEDTTLYNTNRSIIEIENLPDYVVQAFIDAEDKRFYNHKGFDIKRIFSFIYISYYIKKVYEFQPLRHYLH